MKTTTVCMTEPDVERLSLLSGFVRTPLDVAQLANLEEKVAGATVIQPEEVPKDVVTMNSRVALYDLRTAERTICTLAFPAAANPRKGRISVLEPLGTALLGARVGDVLEYRTGEGMERRRVEEILYQPEAAGDLYA